MRHGITLVCSCGHVIVRDHWHECDSPVVAGEKESLVEAWQREGRDVMFNKARDDLTPAQRVGKWLEART